MWDIPGAASAAGGDDEDRARRDRYPSARRISLPADNKWDILEELAAKDEDDLRRILRAHEEAGLTWELDAETIQQRKRFDGALALLTLIEIAQQLRSPSVSDPSAAPWNIPSDAPAHVYDNLRRLFESEAVLHYCDSYLYFGVRFLAERLVPVRDASQLRLRQSPPRESRWRPLALLTPPLAPTNQNVAQEFFDLQHKEGSAEEQAALLFLDGFFDSPPDYELWLRGLLENRDPAQNDRFSKVTAGLLRWMEERVRFYLKFAKEERSEIALISEGRDVQIAAQVLGEGVAGELGPSFEPAKIFKKSAYSAGRLRKLHDRYRPAGGWRMTHPAAARCGLADMYWIARLLRASVSSAGTVTYSEISWLHLLNYRFNFLKEREQADTIAQYEEVLRSVFGYVCELVQNAISVTDGCVREVIAPQEHPTSGVSKDWPYVRDEEFAVVEKQRNIRRYHAEAQQGLGPLPPGAPPSTPAMPGGHAESASGGTAGPPRKPPKKTGPCDEDEGWSQRVSTGFVLDNLVGVAFSGGGIRSATFNLGVLQGLQQLDILRQVDYISTVSGGGFIGSWLVGNVRRSVHWLGRVTDWSASIAHLRAYSNYLAPRTGILSFDTWALATTWLRNTFLIQLTGLAWLFVLMLSALVVKPAFTGLWQPHSILAHGRFVLIASGVVATWAILYQLTKLNVITKDPTEPRNRAGVWFRTKAKAIARRVRSDAEWVRRLCVLPACAGSFCIASLFWRDAQPRTTGWARLDALTGFGAILTSAWAYWLSILIFSLIVLCIIVLLSIRPPYRANSIWIALICGGVLYLGLCGIFYLDLQLEQNGGSRKEWLAYAFTPTLVLFAFALSVVLLIGFTGRYSKEAFREWWTRLGTWLLTAALAALALTGVAAFGPELTAALWNHAHNPALKWGGVVTWAGTVISGLLAGKSSKTNGEGKSPNLQLLAVAGGVFFILGAALLSSALLYFLLFKIFGSDEACYGCYLVTVDHLGYGSLFFTLIGLASVGLLFSYFFELNIFGFNQFYRNRIVRCYLGATRTTPGVRRPNHVSGFDFNDDIKLDKLQQDDALDGENGSFRGPFPIINCALNLGGSEDLSVKTRHSASFTLTPLRCGSDRPLVGYAPTLGEGKGLLGRRMQFAGGLMLGQAVAVSGAAVSPNMGYNTSPLVAFLLTMFNVRLGWWFPNPGRKSWYHGGLRVGLYYLTRELLGLADERRQFLNVSDGGHFENLAVYELIRRQCKVIIACDAECDENYQFGGLGNLIRICEADFGAVIELDVKAIREQKEGFGIAHCSIGNIKYSNGDLGYLIYLKASMTGDEPVGIMQYRAAHPSFPHETTSDQFFSEDQFESYRQLGKHVVEHSFRGTVPGQHPVVIAEKLFDVLTPMGCPSAVFLKHSSTLSGIWDKFRQTPSLYPLLNELMGHPCPPAAPAPPSCSEEVCVVLQLIQLMEDVFLDLRLDDFWEHPDNRGWAMLFMQWSRSPRFRTLWGQTRRTFGIRFEHFCAARLGLERDRPTVRV